MTVTREQWIQWRISMGARKGEAAALWNEHEQLLAALAQQKARQLKSLHSWSVVQDGTDWEKMINAMPRKPYRFLAMVAECERLQTARSVVATKKAIRRTRYMRAYTRRAPTTGADHE